MKWKDKIRDPHCTRCPLHEEAEHVCLMGAGSRKADVMLVGEAPGHREDEEHQAFVGAAGQLLTKMLLEHAGLERRDCYITNVAKCRPPDNRTPTKSEMKTCVGEFFIPELEQVNPKYVLLLGNSALQGVIGRSGITKHRGTRWELEGFTAMATFHPAAMLRNPKYGEALAADLQRFGQMCRGVDLQPKTRVKFVKNKAQLRWLIGKLAAAEEISYDIETNGLKEFLPESRIVSIAFTLEEGSAIFLPLHHDNTPWSDPQKVLDAIKDVMEDPTKKYVAHNGMFDNRWLQQFGITVPQTFDTMLAGHMIDENRPKSLKHLSQVILNADAYDIGDEIKKAAEVPLGRLGHYNGKDTDYTMRLYHFFKAELRKDPRVARVFKFLMMPASNALTDIERRGIQVDMEKWTEANAKAHSIRQTIEDAMRKRVPMHKRTDFNFQSPPQLAEWLFEDLGLNPIEKTKTGANSTKESVLLQLAKHSKECAALLKWRKWNKYITTYLSPWMEHVDEQLRLHPRYKLFGTVTGRLSSSDPNLQNVPRNPFIRGILGAEKGKVFVEADFSQVELRIAAMLARERHMLTAFANGEDLHLKTAASGAKILPEDVTKEIRKKAKAENFGFLYAMGAEKFVIYARDNYDVEYTLEEAQLRRERFFETYPGLRPWHERQKRLARRYHYVSSPLGRKRHLPDIVSQDKAVRAEAERQAINSPVQSTASDLMLISLVLLHRKGIPIIGTIHDALLFELERKKLKATLPVIKHTMEVESLAYAKRHFGAIITVPIVADVEVGLHWSQGKEWHE